MSESVYIVAGKRTPIGAFQGQLSPFKAPELASKAISACLEEIGLDPSRIDDVYMGCVLSAGLGQAPARQAALGAGVPNSVPCTTLNKMCGSGLQAVILAADRIRARGGIVLAGGMESMTQAPYLMPQHRGGQRLGHGVIKDHMFLDGLEDAYDGKLMGVHTQKLADEKGLTRERMDEFALTSLARAVEAQKTGAFAQELVPVSYELKGQQVHIEIDEPPLKARPEKIPTLKPAFAKDGTLTAANSSSIADGAASLLLCSESELPGMANNGQPKARIVGYSSHAQLPSEFGLAPVGAIRTLLSDIGWSTDSVDLFEINEAFAAVTLFAIDDLALDANKVNVHGGACALGHPIGASGARILITLMHALQQKGLKRGIASLCIGGGEAVALAIELV